MNTTASGTSKIKGGLVVMEMTLVGLIALFGISGNILTIRVLRVPNLSKTSTACYFTILAAVDILVLLIGPTTRGTAAVVYGDERQFRDAHVILCKAQLFLIYTFSQISAWILVAVTLDRMVWVLFPFKARQFCTIKHAILVAGLIVSLICGVNGRHLWYFTLNTSDNKTQCTANDTFIKHTYVNYVDPALVTIGPFLVMLIANLLIIRKLHQVKVKREKSLHKASSKRKDGSNLTTMLLCTSIFYLVSSLPYLILQQVLKEKRSEFLKLSTLTLNIVYLIQVCSYSLFNLNYAIHFLLYCLAGPAFKAEAFRLLKIRRGDKAARQAGGDGGGGANGGVTATTGGEVAADNLKLPERDRKEKSPTEDADEAAVELLDKPQSSCAHH